MKEYLVRFWPIIYIAVFWFIFASPYFLQGLVPYSSKYQVNFFPPWSHYEKFLGPVKNNAMPDIHTQIYPWKKFTIDTYKEGKIPFWNPYGFSGNPHLANFQTAVFSPFNTLFFVFPFIDAWSLLILLQPLLAGICIYILAREYKLSKISSLLSVVCFMFCGFLVVWMAYGTLGYAILFLPLSLACIEKYLKKPHFKYFCLFLLTIPLSLFSGHFQTSLYGLLFVSAYLIWKFFDKGNRRHIVQLIGGFILGIIASLPQLLPTIQLYQHSVRSEIYITGGGIPFYYLITTIAPDFFGNPVTRNDWFGFYAEWGSFVGIIPLFMAVIAACYNRGKTTVFYLIMTGLTLLLAVDSSMQAILGSLKIPVLSTSAPGRIIVLYSFCIAVLSGFGMEYIINNYKSKKLLYIFVSFLLIFTAIWLYIFIGKPLEADKLIIAQRNFILPSILFLISFGILLGIRFIKKTQFIYGAFLLVVALSSFDSFRYVQKWMPFDPKSLVYPDVAVISAIQKNIGYGRMFGNFGGETAVYYKIPSIEGYDPLYIGRYGEFLRVAASGEVLPAERSVAKIDRKGKYTDRALDLLGVTLIFQPMADTNQSWAYPVWDDPKRNTLVYTDDKFELFKNNEALGRVHLFYNYVVEENSSNILTVLFSPDFKYRDTLILEENPHIEKKTDVEKGTAIISSYNPDKVIVNVNTTVPALLLLSDNYYPGWKAQLVRGSMREELKIFRANYTFRAVKVPAGNFVVEFYYIPVM